MIQVVARRALTAWLTGAVLIASVAACADHTGGKSRSASPSVTASKPGPVALAYMRAIARGDFKAAIPLVAPNQRAVLQALALGQGPGTLPTVTGDVSVGAVTEDADSATVSILGTLCRGGTSAGPSTSPSGPDCIENHDPKTDSPVFLVHLARQGTAGWSVVLNFGAAGGPGAPGGADGPGGSVGPGGADGSGGPGGSGGQGGSR